MSYGNGTVGICGCGALAVAHCHRCGRTLCETHVREYPDSPPDLSEQSRGRYNLAVRVTDGAHCLACREEIGNQVLMLSASVPRLELPDHWLDRAIALSGDGSRSEEEKRHDQDLPHGLTPTDVAAEFLRRMENPPVERVPITPPRMFSDPVYVEGWTVDCRRTDYAPTGVGGRYTLPCMISVEGELLGPLLEDDTRHGPTWWIVPETDIDLQRLVASVARILVMSVFHSQAPAATDTFGTL